jgi:predicted phosphoadenosine phosphosulfate sulfurtransferase
VQFVDHYRGMDWVRMTWFAVPMESNKFVLGQSTRYVQWDPRRTHLREIPAHATTLADLGLPADTVLSQYDMDAVTARPFKGRVAILTGIRASESLMRWQACVVKLNENYITASAAGAKASLCKPIFDWHENDVFRFFYDYGIRYCPLYDAQAWSSSPLRVSTPLHAEAAKSIGNLRATCPVFYDQVMDLFPEMAVQERYYRELDRAAAVAAYAKSWEGIARWIHEHVTDPAQHAKAMARFDGARKAARLAPGSYPLDYVLKQFMIGAYKRRILPQALRNRSKKARQAR